VRFGTCVCYKCGSVLVAVQVQFGTCVCYKCGSVLVAVQVQFDTCVCYKCGSVRVSVTSAVRYLCLLQNCTSNLILDEMLVHKTSPCVTILIYVCVFRFCKNEMDLACSAYGGEERRIQGFGGET